TIFEFIGPQLVAAGKDVEELKRLVNQQIAENANDSDVVVAGLVGRGGGGLTALVFGRPRGLQTRARLTRRGGGGLTALVFAAREGDLESAKLLVAAGADINQTTEYGWTPLLT